MLEDFKALAPFWFNHLYVEAGETIRAIPAQVQYMRHVLESLVDGEKADPVSDGHMAVYDAIKGKSETKDEDKTEA